MKAAANGVLNCSILDGWWVEGYAPDVGWAIGRGEDYTDPTYQDHVESQALYDLLEKQIVPLFYSRGVDNLPARVDRADEELHAQARRRCSTPTAWSQDYAEMFYIPAFDRGAAAGGRRPGPRRSRWRSAKDSLRRKWRGIRIVGVHTSGNGHFKVGEQMQVEAMVDLPGVDPKDLSVQLYAGPINATRRDRAAAGADRCSTARRWPPTGTCSSARSTAAPAAARASRSASSPATKTWRRRSSRG